MVAARPQQLTNRQRFPDPSGVLYEHLCFEAQPAAEKAIKAVFVHRKIRFAPIHDLMVLLTMLQQEGIEIPPAILEADTLTRYAVRTRYPRIADEVIEEDYLEAIQLAEAIYRWAEAQIRGEKKES